MTGLLIVLVLAIMTGILSQLTRIATALSEIARRGRDL